MGIYGKSDTVVVWSLFQYVSPTGRKAIEDWRNSLALSRRADFDVFMRNMVKRSKWEYPEIGGLSGKHLKGFFELRWRSENVPHRVGGYFPSDDEFLMLIGWTHNAKKYDPPSALETLRLRKMKLNSGEASGCEYEIATGRTAER